MLYCNKAERLFLAIYAMTVLSLWLPEVESQTQSTFVWEQDQNSVKVAPTAFMAKYCDFPGNDIVTKAPGYVDVYACMAACQANPKCTHFLYIRQTSESPHKYYCYLKSKFGDASTTVAPTPDSTTDMTTCGFLADRIMLLPGQAWYPSVAWKTDSISTVFAKDCDFPGDDIITQALNVPNQDACIDGCNKNSKCTHFTYFAKGSFCWLKKKTGQVKIRYLDSNIADTTCGFRVDRIIPGQSWYPASWQSNWMGAAFAKDCDFPGDEIASAMPVDTPQECMEECQKNVNCTHFTSVLSKAVVSQPYEILKTYRCWLKRKTGQVQIANLDPNKYGSTCGFLVNRIMSSGQAWYPTSVGWQTNRIGTLFAKDCDFPGDDIISQALNVPNQDACIDGCNKNLKCTHFTYVARGSFCWLKKKTGQVKIAYLDSNMADSTCGVMVDRMDLSGKTIGFNWQLSSIHSYFYAEHCDFGGNDISPRPYYSPSYSWCAYDCIYKNPKCTHFTYTNTQQNCYLKVMMSELVVGSLDVNKYNSVCGFLIDRVKTGSPSSVSVTNGYTWPDWNYLPTNTTCPSGTAAIAFTLKLQPYTKLMFPSMSGDRRKTNRAVVGLRLHCGNRNGQLISTIESEMKIYPGYGDATWGEMSPICNLSPAHDGKFYSKLTSFRMKVHQYYNADYIKIEFANRMSKKELVQDSGFDVLGVTDIAFKCSVPGVNNIGYITPSVIRSNTRYWNSESNLWNKEVDKWGDWSATCGNGICGFRGRFDDFQLSFLGKSGDRQSYDDAGLTNLEMRCCPDNW